MTGGPPPHELEKMAVSVAKEAAALVRDFVGKADSVGTKSSSTDVVTSTDMASEELVRRRLAELTPGSAVVGEEQADTIGHSGVGWIVDPIDGTVNFLYDLPVIAVSIAATMHGTIVAGAVVDVLRRETFSAHLDGGARRDDRPVTVGTPADLGQALIATGFSYDPGIRHTQGRIVSRLVSQARDVRCFGSAALQLCWVGCGRLDGYYETDLKPWDVAAGGLVAAEAGATVEWPQSEGDLILAAAPKVFQPLRDQLLGPLAAPILPAGGLP